MPSKRLVNPVFLAMMLVLVTRAWSQSYNVLYEFTGEKDGNAPEGGLLRDSAGNLYGTTVVGGKFGLGTVFKLDTSGNESVLHDFAGGTDGEYPYLSGLTIDANGNLYGSTFQGGSPGGGTVFKVTRTGQETVLHSFSGQGVDGLSPYGGVITDAAGNLYGTTSFGGAFDAGTVFRLDKIGKETFLYSFGTPTGDGLVPTAGLVMDASGNLYGTTLEGGTANLGTVFEITAGGKETVIHSFTGGTDGATPYYAPVVIDAEGNLYGTTSAGGSANLGVVFEIPAGGKETVLHNFTGAADGATPWAGLILDSTGNLYGTTTAGGAWGMGTIFELTPSSGNWVGLHSFAGFPSDGYFAVGNLALDPSGNLYAAAAGGSPEDSGVVSELTTGPLGPAVAITPPYLVFQNANSVLPLTVTNSGTAPLNITVPPGFVGFDGFDFAVVANGTTCVNGTTLAAGASCVANVTFRPLTTSAESASLLLYDNAVNGPQAVPLSGGAILTSISPNPVLGSNAAQTISVMGNGFVDGVVLNWRDLTNGGSGPVTPLTVTPNELMASLNFTNATAAWQIQVSDPGVGQSNWFSFEVLASQFAAVKDDYPFQNATIDGEDPYGFKVGLRECTSYVAWRMNRDAGTTNPDFPYFFNTMDNKRWGDADNWASNAVALGYTLDTVPQVGDIAQWVNGCGGGCVNGHVAYVEEVAQDSSVVVSEYNFPEEGALHNQFGVRRIAASSQYFPQNFIHVLSVVLNADLLNFGSQRVGTRNSMALEIYNDGSGPVQVTDTSLSDPTNFSYAYQGTCTTIPVYGGCTVTVTFKPSTAGAHSATIKVTDIAGPQLTQTIILTGTGT